MGFRLQAIPTARLGSADGGRDLPIGSRFPVGDPAQRFPDSDLKGRSAEFQGEIKGRPLLRKVFLKLTGRKIGDRGGRVGKWHIAAPDGSDKAVFVPDFDCPERTVVSRKMLHDAHSE